MNEAIQLLQTHDGRLKSVGDGVNTNSAPLQVQIVGGAGCRCDQLEERIADLEERLKVDTSSIGVKLYVNNVDPKETPPAAKRGRKPKVAQVTN